MGRTKKQTRPVAEQRVSQALITKQLKSRLLAAIKYNRALTLEVGRANSEILALSYLALSEAEARNLIEFLEPQYISHEEYPQVHELFNRLSEYLK